MLYGLLIVFNEQIFRLKLFKVKVLRSYKHFQLKRTKFARKAQNFETLFYKSVVDLFLLHL
jgi:hypothetical protein